MIAQSTSYAANGGGNRTHVWPFAISFVVHAVIMALLIWSPNWGTEPPSYLPSVIDVQMVDLTDAGAAPVQKKVSTEEKAPVVKEEKTEPSQAAVSTSDSAAKPEISVAKPRKKTKKALKYKTYKSKKVVKNAIQRVEKKLETQSPKPLEDTIKKLRQKVAKEGRPGQTTEQTPKTDKAGKVGVYGRGSKKEIEVIDLYRLEVAYAINKNWAFAGQLSGGGNKIMASIAFKVMPDGEIRDIFFTDRSGNQHLDDSAYKAIVKTSPVKPHPEKLSRSYVEMGLRFTPEGVR